MADMGMMDHIAAHCVQVCKVATRLTYLFIDRGIELNRELIYSAALLHDITKTRSLETGENHAATGSELLISLDYPDVARIVGQHVRLASTVDQSTSPGEEEIVNYADKRVLHDRVGSLRDRRHYILERYGTEPARREMIRLMFEDSILLEKKLFGLLRLQPSILDEMVERPEGSRELRIFRSFVAGSDSPEEQAEQKPQTKLVETAIP